MPHPSPKLGFPNTAPDQRLRKHAQPDANGQRASQSRPQDSAGLRITSTSAQPGSSALSPRKVARDQRNSSPWIPADPRSPALDPNLSRDSLAQDPFFRTYMDPALEKVVDHWRKEINGAKDISAQSRAYLVSLSTERTASALGLKRKPSKSPRHRSDSRLEINLSVIGASRVGKSTFISQALGTSHPEKDPAPRQLNVEANGVRYPVLLRLLERSCTDQGVAIGSDARSSQSRDPAKTHTDGAVVLFDISNAESLDLVPLILRAIHKDAIPHVVVCTKCDVDARRRKVDPDEIEQRLRSVDPGLSVIQTSSKSFDDVRRCLGKLLREVITRGTQPDASPATRPRGQSNASSPTQIDEGLTRFRTRSMSSTARESNRSSEHSDSTADAHQSLQLPVQHPPIPESEQAEESEYNRSVFDDMNEPFSPGSFLDDRSTIDRSSRTSVEINEADGQQDASDATVQVECTFYELVSRLLEPADPKSGARFTAMFLLLYRMFSAPSLLLETLIGHYRSPISQSSSFAMGKSLKILCIIEQWIGWYPGDFGNHATRSLLGDFISRIDKGSAHGSIAKNIESVLGSAVHEDDDTRWAYTDAKRKRPRTVDTFLSMSSIESSKTATDDDANSSEDRDLAADLASHLEPKAVFHDPAAPLTLTAMGPTTAQTDEAKAGRIMVEMTNVARGQAKALLPRNVWPLTKIQWRQIMALPEDSIALELTRIDWIMFTALRARDAARHITLPPSEHEHFPALQNVTRWIDHFNHLALWTTNLILLRDKPKHRALMLEKLMRVSRKVRELNNYNTLAALIAGVQGTAVHRLGATRALVPESVTKDFMKLEILMSNSKSHFAYYLAWENTTLPRIPFIALHRRMLVAAEAGSKTFVGATGDDDAGRRINWSKFSVMGDIMLAVDAARTQPYRGLVPNEEVRGLVLDLELTTDEEELYERSLALEASASGTGQGPAQRVQRRIQPILDRYGIGEGR